MSKTASILQAHAKNYLYNWIKKQLKNLRNVSIDPGPSDNAFSISRDTVYFDKI